MGAMLLVGAVRELLILLFNPHPTNAQCWKGIEEVDGNDHL